MPLRAIVVVLWLVLGATSAAAKHCPPDNVGDCAAAISLASNPLVPIGGSALGAAAGIGLARRRRPTPVEVSPAAEPSVEPSPVPSPSPSPSPSPWPSPSPSPEASSSPEPSPSPGPSPSPSPVSNRIVWATVTIRKSDRPDLPA